MSGRTDRRLEEGVRKALALGPKDVVDLLATLRGPFDHTLDAREGLFHAFLHGLVRRGEVVVGAPSARGLVTYALPGEGAAPTPRVPSAAGDPEAGRIAAGLRKEEARARVAADVTAHRAALAEAGLSSRFGSPKSARLLLRRADRGFPTVVYAREPLDVVGRFLLHEGPWIVMAVIVYFVLRAWVAEVFVIPSRSMVPTLEVGDRVLVFKPGGQARPERFSIVTFERDGITYVKRAAGLGGERIEILGGDVYADGELTVKPENVREALRFPYRAWDLGAGDPSQEWAVEESVEGARRWTYEGGPLWSGGDFSSGGGRDIPLRDVYLELRGERAEGGALAVALDYVAPEEAGGEARALALLIDDDHVRLVEIDHDPLQVALPSDPRRLPDGLQVVAEAEAPGGTLVARLSYVDGIVRADCGGLHFSGNPPRLPPLHAPVRPVVSASGPAPTGPGRLLLDKDVHYTLAGELGVAPALSFGQPGDHAFQISPGHVFLLGDNTYDSRDSRFRGMGEVAESELVGPVVFRIWPPSRVGRVR